MNEEFKKSFKELRIKQLVVGIESHPENGSVERVSRSIREGIFKLGNLDLSKKIHKVRRSYNTTYLIGISCIPQEEPEGANYEAVACNSENSKYKKKFKPISTEIFRKGDEVRITKRENQKGKDRKGRFT